MIKLRETVGCSCQTCPYNHLCLPHGLAKAEVVKLDELLSTIRILSKKENAFYANDTIQNLYAVFRGSCKESWLDENGNERITNFYFPGDIIGMESISEKKHMFTVTALEESELCVIPFEPFLNLMQNHPAILQRFIQITGLKMLNDQSLHLGITAVERVCDVILHIVMRMRERNPLLKYIPLSMSQLDISNFLGIAYETVNRIFKNLQNKKIIKIQNKTLCVLDLEKLEQLGRLRVSPVSLELLSPEISST